ncbi:isochorismatase family protein [Glaciecola sp. SC05]|uniref:isochorismatase family protein n=1 Tax=Glaciecola sp. SC05 TaxID=1987355 RepID=UPI003528B378
MSKDLPIGDIALGKRPALIVVDMSEGFARAQSPLGGDFTNVIAANKTLVNVFRQKQLPIFFTSVVYHEAKQASVFRQRLPDLNILQAGSKWVEIAHELGRKSNEPIIEKLGPSGFFETSLANGLRQANADSLVVTGLTTSGCVRATVVDGLQHNYPVFVPIEACGDRNLAAQQANFHDMNAKYAQVLKLETLLALLA